jgi:hypothetical protein
MGDNDNLIERIKEYIKENPIVAGIIIIIGLALMVGIATSIIENINTPVTQPAPVTSPTPVTPPTPEKINDGVILNVTDISVNAEESNSVSKYSNDSKTSHKYSHVGINFDVETNGSINNCSVTVKFYNGDKLIGTGTTSSYDKIDLVPGINHKTISFSSSGDSGLPSSGTLTDIIISFEANINGVNKILFEASKVNVGSINLYYTEIPNPYYGVSYK